MIDLRIVAAAGALALSFGAGWVTQGWRADARVATIEAERSRAVAAANASTLAAQRALDGERDRKAVELSEIDQAGTRRLNEVQDENDRLKRCVADGTCGVRIRTVTRACPAGDVPGAATAGSVDLGTEAELAPDLRPLVLDLRRGIEETEVTLQKCQQSLDALTKVRSAGAP